MDQDQNRANPNGAGSRETPAERLARARAVFVKEIARDFRDEITGEKTRELVGENPENRFLVGKLLPRNEEKEDENTSFVFIKTVGLDFYLKPEGIREAEVTVAPRGEFYYRCYPTLEQQMNYIRDLVRDGNRCPIVPVYRKCSFGGPGDALHPEITFRPWELLGEDGEEGALAERSSGPREPGECGAMRGLLEDLIAQAKADPYCYTCDATGMDRNELEKMRSEEDYLQRFVKPWKENRSPEDQVEPSWNFSVRISVKRIRKSAEGGERYLVSVTLINESEVYGNKKTHASNSQRSDKPSIETMFNAGLDVTLRGGAFAPIDLRYFQNDYKYDRCQMAIGRNCSPVYHEAERCLSTEHIPTYVQKRLNPREDPELQVSFEELSRGDLIRRLEGIWEKMGQEYRRREHFLDPAEEKPEQFLEELRRFRRERDRFRDGIDLMKRYPEILRSFRLMNEAFLQNAEVFHKFKTWRLFQLVYIVSLIPDIAVCDPRMGEQLRDRTDTYGDPFGKRLEEVSLLYFPTGGGKTEAFLGVLVFNLFFDRFRGKKYGVTSILRYPLRLLSIQQVQRLANILAQAELLRRREEELWDSDEFSLGYFVGSANTPNRISEKERERYKKAQEEESEGRKGQTRLDEERIIDVCPFCGKKTVHLRFFEDSCRLGHYCEDPRCPSRADPRTGTSDPRRPRPLPVYMVDTEIYRALPSAIISTVDKLATLGLNASFRAILAGAPCRCPRHGFTTGDFCRVEGCREPSSRFQRFWFRKEGRPDAAPRPELREFYDPAPTLFIQDELHLIRESLGTYSSHYESFMNYFTERLSPSGRKVKTIGATATISSYEEQVNELYNRGVVRFPCECPDLKDLFYARIDESDDQRRIMGFAPFGKAAITAMAYAMKYMRVAVNRYRVRPERMGELEGMPENLTEAEARRILEDYWIFLEYNNVKRDGNNLEGLLETPVNVELREAGIPEFVTRQMTGDEDFHTVREILSNIEIMSGEEMFQEGKLNTIVATSMISHGVDADRFNIMFFFGVPNNTAEYVQAYSRTGRKHPSLVIDLIRPSRETDMSYLHNFVKFHDYKDILVESVPLDRWAVKAIQRTLPGIFAGLLLNYYNPRIMREHPGAGSLELIDNVRSAMKRGWLNREEVTEHLKRSYGCQTQGGGRRRLGLQYENYIEQFTEWIFQRIPKIAWDEKQSLTSGFSVLHDQGMPCHIVTSMRDTDDQLIIELASYGQRREEGARHG